MEGPSIHLAAEQLRPFIGRRVLGVSGNSRIGIERLARVRVKNIFAWGKHLVFQFDTFAMRVHFMLWGTFAATVNGESVTGDYRRSGPPRLVLSFTNGEITIWSASLKFLDHRNAAEEYDFSVDVLSDTWDPKAALTRTRTYPEAEIADVLLDQAIFAGVGNIIKNEVLFRTRTSPFARVGTLSRPRLKAIVDDARTFSFRFLELRRVFALRKNLEVYGRSVCTNCGGKVSRRIHGTRGRRSFFCVKCQRVRATAVRLQTNSR
jgi:endonuclease VIII